jgi:diguanylate cyclase (GGDEF)-like protein/PAS domain S-box-containing protein
VPAARRSSSAPGSEEPPIDGDRLLDALLSSPSLAVVGADREGSITLWSAGAARLYGWSEQELLGRHLSLLVPDDRRHELEVAQRVLAGETVPSLETQRRARDGALVQVELELVLLRNPEGTPTGTLALHRDLRGLQRVRRALEATEQELRARFDDSPVAQARVDLGGRLLASNRALQEMLGWDGASLLGRNGVELYAEDDRPAVLEALARLISGEIGQLTQEHTLVRADGVGIRALTTASVMPGPQRPQLAVSVEDVTALREAEQRVQVEAARYEALLQTMPVVVFTYDLDGRCTSSRGAALSTLGYAENELAGADLLEMYAGFPEVQEALRAPLAGQESRSLLEQAGHHWKSDYRPLRDASGEVAGGIGISVDITELVSAEQELRGSQARLHCLLQHASDLALVIDSKGCISYVSPAVTRLLGYAEQDLDGRSAREFHHPEDRQVVSTAWRDALSSPGATARFECRVLHADGTWRWAEHVFTNLLEDPAVNGFVVNVRETTERRLAEEELRQLTVRDGLTGLANRTLLLDRVEQALRAGRRSGTIAGLIVLDVVGMGAHNHELGQQGGDAVLQAVAARLKGALRSGDSAARVGGGQFAVLVPDVASVEDLRALTSTLLEVAQEPVGVPGGTATVRLKAGSALAPADDAGSLLAAAEQAMRAGRPLGVVRDPAPPGAAPAMARSASADRLRRAIEDGELVLHFQPVLDLASEEVAGAEALVRWQHPERGLLLPGEFIPLAEESGLVVEVGGWVLREACARLAAWHAEGRELSVAVNLSPRQLVGTQFLELLRELLAQTRVPPERLVLEVTESALMDDAQAPEMLRAVRATGVHLALDDFGTGYSSLTYLRRFPVDAIKVDRSFVSGLGRDPDDEAIVASVVSLARAVGKKVVAEGVETPQQLAALSALGVDQAQGFLWSRAVSAVDLDLWLEQPRARFAAPPQPAPAAPPAAELASGSDEERILVLHREGASLHTIAAALNAEGRRAAGGTRWSTKTVARVVAALLPPT